MKKEDLYLDRMALSKKVTELCNEFMTATGEDYVEVFVRTQDATLTTDSKGRTCYGRVLTVGVDSWREDEEDEE